MTNLSKRLNISLSVNVVLGLLVVFIGSLDRFEQLSGYEISTEKGSSFEEGFSAGSNDPVVSTDRLSDSIETRNEFDESKEESFDEKDFENYLEEHGFRVVPESIFEKVYFGVLTGEGRLSEDVQRLFSFNENEVAQINQQIEETVNQLREKELERMEITSLSDDEIVFEISPLTADEVDSIQDRLYQQIASEIGEFDAGFLWNIMLHGWSEGYWRDFGRSGSRISFRFDEIDGEKWIHSASWDAIEGDWRGGKTGYRFLPERIFPGMQTFLERQSYLIDYLPDDFRLTGEH